MKGYQTMSESKQKKIRCNICLIFNNQFTKVVLIKRLKDPYKGKLNGIGGKLNYRENRLTGILREVKEELGIKLEKDKLKKFCTIDDGSYIMDVFFSTINVEALTLPLSTREGLVNWYEVDNLFRNEEGLAGSGFLRYLLYSITKEI